jgi:asparagine synthase (glutamine-hydrolysing)
VCGICGSTGTDAQQRVAAMAARLVHRGPDDEGMHVAASSPVAIGARRLSIIDVEGGHQPLANEDGTVWAVLNGEIYNHPALQERLRTVGHGLRTRCDTEVLVHLYEDFDADLVHALDGMFAFAIVDERRARLLLARDRFGEKPLFYAVGPHGLVFASELTALIAGLGEAAPRLDREALDAYFTLGYVPAPSTLVAGVRQLPAGSLLDVDLRTGRTQERLYWAPPIPDGRLAGMSELDAVRETAELLERSVRSRLIADVPLGVLLSGGLDSTLITALARRHGDVRTFTVGYEGSDLSEAPEAARIAAQLGTAHEEVVLTLAELADNAQRVVDRLDQPLADPATCALHAVCRLARGHVTVAMGGEGADEVFGGYPRYAWLRRAEAVGRVLPSRLRAGARRGIRELPLRGRSRRLADVLDHESTAGRHLDWVSEGRRTARSALYGPALAHLARSGGVERRIAHSLHGAGSLEARLMRLDQRLWLVDDVLAKADRAGMLASLELRTPYLERSLVEFAAGVPTATHLRHGGKALLRQALRLIAPGVHPGSKTAFRIPLAACLRGPMAGALEERLLGGRALRDGVFAADAVRAALEEHRRGADRSPVLWPLYVFAAWYERADVSP